VWCVGQLTGVSNSGVVTGLSCLITIALPRSKSQIRTGVSVSTFSQRIFSGFKSRCAMPTIHKKGVMVMDTDLLKITKEPT